MESNLLQQLQPCVCALESQYREFKESICEVVEEKHLAKDEITDDGDVLRTRYYKLLPLPDDKNQTFDSSSFDEYFKRLNELYGDSPAEYAKIRLYLETHARVQIKMQSLIEQHKNEGCLIDESEARACAELTYDLLAVSSEIYGILATIKDASKLRKTLPVWERLRLAQQPDTELSNFL